MIDIKNMSKIYRSKESELYAVNDVSLHVDEGEFLVIMGRSGCGKSTLLNILGLIDTFDEGTYFLENADMKQADANALARLRLSKIGYIYSPTIWWMN